VANPWDNNGRAGAPQRFARGIRPEGLPPPARNAKRIMAAQQGLAPQTPGVFYRPLRRAFYVRRFAISLAELTAKALGNPAINTQSPPQIAADNIDRIYLLIQNQGADNLYVNFGQPAGVGDILIIPGGNYEPTHAIPTNAIYIFCPTSTFGCLVMADDPIRPDTGPPEG
jgi:hypothetical protein